MAARFHTERERDFGVLVWSCSLVRVLEKRVVVREKLKSKYFDS